MDYFVLYDMNDNVIAYFANKIEMCNFTGVRFRDVNCRFKNKQFIQVVINDIFYKIYKFS